MALSFAVITEGVSEHIIIKHIISHFFKEDTIINQLQPLIDVKGQQLVPGGWNEVLKYCSQEAILQSVLEYNDYIVIQIDTDMSEIEPYSVSKLNDKGERVTNEILWERVHKRLLEEICETIDKNRILFAICIDEAECWLLPAVCSVERKKSAYLNCCYRLNDELVRLNEAPIIEKTSVQAIRSYLSVLKKMKKRREIESIASYHYGFLQFIEQLKKVEFDNVPKEE